MRYQKTNEVSEAWDFVGVAQDRDDSAKKIVILRPERGDDVFISIETFHAGYQLQPGKSSASSDAIRETLANIRQISTIRFVGLPFFLATSAGIAKTYATDPWSQLPLVARFGLGLALVGVVFEIVLSRNLTCWWQALQAEITARPWSMVNAHRNAIAVWAARIALFFPYLAAVYYWASIVTGRGDAAWAISGVCFGAGVAVWGLARPR